MIAAAVPCPDSVERSGLSLYLGAHVVARTAGRSGRPWRRVQAKVYEEETHCYLCGEYVDQTLANFRSGRARSVHHLIPPDLAPELALDRDNLRLAHLGCNARYGRGAFVGGPALGPPKPDPGVQQQGHPALEGWQRWTPAAPPRPLANASRVW